MFALKGLREFHLFPFKYRGGVECVLACAHASVSGTIERKGRGKEEIRGETGFSESAPGTCYVTWNRAIVSPIPVQLVLESMDKHLLTSGKAFLSERIPLSYLQRKEVVPLWWNFLSSIKVYIFFDWKN